MRRVQTHAQMKKKRIVTKMMTPRAAQRPQSYHALREQ
jgi:hypothetical protein